MGRGETTVEITEASQLSRSARLEELHPVLVETCFECGREITSEDELSYVADGGDDWPAHDKCAQERGYDPYPKDPSEGAELIRSFAAERKKTGASAEVFTAGITPRERRVLREHLRGARLIGEEPAFLARALSPKR